MAHQSWHDYQASGSGVLAKAPGHGRPRRGFTLLFLDIGRTGQTSQITPLSTRGRIRRRHAAIGYGCRPLDTAVH